jgi:hypothetical protein
MSFFDDKELVSAGTETIEDVLITWGNEVIGKLKTSLRANISSGTSLNLEQSMIIMPIEFKTGKFVLTFKADEYWKYLNKGVQGAGGVKADNSIWEQKAAGSPFSFKDKKPPVKRGEGISLWAYTKGLNEWAVAESVFRKGIKATNFWDDVINKQLVSDLVTRLEKAGAREVEILLSKDFQ